MPSLSPAVGPLPGLVPADVLGPGLTQCVHVASAEGRQGFPHQHLVRMCHLIPPWIKVIAQSSRVPPGRQDLAQTRHSGRFRRRPRIGATSASFHWGSKVHLHTNSTPPPHSLHLTAVFALAFCAAAVTPAAPGDEQERERGLLGPPHTQLIRAGGVYLIGSPRWPGPCRRKPRGSGL